MAVAAVAVGVTGLVVGGWIPIAVGVVLSVATYAVSDSRYEKGYITQQEDQLNKIFAIMGGACGGFGLVGRSASGATVALEQLSFGVARVGLYTEGAEILTSEY